MTQPDYESMPTREKMKPRGSAPHLSVQKDNNSWVKKVEKEVDRCQKMNYYLNNN